MFLVPGRAGPERVAISRLPARSNRRVKKREGAAVLPKLASRLLRGRDRADSEMDRHKNAAPNEWRNRESLWRARRVSGAASALI